MSDGPQSLVGRVGAMRPVASHLSEPEFLNLYRQIAAQLGLDDNPDGQFYDYRAALNAGARPDESGHWPSQYKQPGHPAMVVGGFHVQTGARVPGAPLAKSLQELIDLGWEPRTAQRLWAQEHGK